MKKIFTLLAAASMAASAWAAVPTLLLGNEEVENDKVYEVGYTEESFDFGTFVMIQYTQDSHLFIRALEDEEVSVEVKASEKIQVCGIDHQCVNTNNVTKTGYLEEGEVVDGYVTEDLKIDLITTDTTGADPADLLHNIDVEVKAYYTDTPDEYVKVTVKLTNQPYAGLADLTVDNGNIHLGYGNTLEYNVNQPMKLDVYNVNGGLVMSQKIFNTGSISLDSLHPGVYIYSAGNINGKILVRK